MIQYDVVPATRVAANQLAPHLRLSDVAEIKAASGQQPLAALLESIEASDPDMCWALRMRSLPVALFGANRLSEEDSIGGIWMLGSRGIAENKRDFMRKSHEYVRLMHERYEYLTNFILEKNYIARRWVQQLGFVPVQRLPHYGAGRVPFIQYVSKRT